MKINQLSREYLESAKRIRERITLLKQLQKTKDFENQKKLEDRITLLSAEHAYLLKMAGYLEHYYDKENISSQRNKGKIA